MAAAKTALSTSDKLLHPSPLPRPRAPARVLQERGLRVYVVDHGGVFLVRVVQEL